MIRQFKIIEEALADVKSAIAFHIETFGEGVFEDEVSILEAFVNGATGKGGDKGSG